MLKWELRLPPPPGVSHKGVNQWVLVETYRRIVLPKKGGWRQAGAVDFFLARSYI